MLPHVPQVWNLLPLRLLLWTSPLVLEAITRANEHLETETLFGRPINAGWLSRGYVWSDETGWSEGKIWIPVNGVKANGTLHVRGGQADGPWVFSELRLVRDDGRTIDLLAPVAQSTLIPLAKDVRILSFRSEQCRGWIWTSSPSSTRNGMACPSSWSNRFRWSPRLSIPSASSGSWRKWFN